jgi:hypothetical protein
MKRAPTHKEHASIRSSRHSLKFSNKGKRENLHTFLVESRRVLQLIIDALWAEGYRDDTYHFNISEQKYRLPALLSSSYLAQFRETWLSARMLQACASQASSIIRSRIQKRSQQIYVMKRLQRKGQACNGLQSKIDRNPLTKPIVHDGVPIILDQRFVTWRIGTSWDVFVGIASLARPGLAYEGLAFNPMRFTSVSNKWGHAGTRKKSIALNEDSITLIYELPIVSQREGKIVGADQGYKTCLTLSDGQATAATAAGHSLETIATALSRKKKGSRSFRKARDHRLNYVNWAVKSLDLTHVSEVRYEDVTQVRVHKHTRFKPLRHWTYPLILAALMRRHETEGFRIIPVDPTYRSQRCSTCGLVLKENRHGKEYWCRCGNRCDADLNAAINLSLDLPEIPTWVRRSRWNLKGFYWNREEPIVPLTTKLEA